VNWSSTSRSLPSAAPARENAATQYGEGALRLPSRIGPIASSSRATIRVPRNAFRGSPALRSDGADRHRDVAWPEIMKMGAG